MTTTPHWEDFQFGIPFSKSHVDEKGLRYVYGMATNEDWDQQDEQMVLAGMDYSPLEKGLGWINWNHSHKPEDQIGLPVQCEMKDWQGRPAFFVKAVLLPDVPRADHAWTLMESLEKVAAMGGPKQTLGWSVEGGVLRKENGRILKAVIRAVALTQEPVVASTFAEMCKSFGTERPEIEIDLVNKTMSSGGDVNPTQATAADQGAALRLENLSTGKKKKDDDEDHPDGLTTVLLSLGELRRSLAASPSPYYDARTGRFVKGMNGMYDHLTRIERMPPRDAAHLISWLRNQTRAD